MGSGPSGPRLSPSPELGTRAGFPLAGEVGVSIVRVLCWLVTSQTVHQQGGHLVVGLLNAVPLICKDL